MNRLIIATQNRHKFSEMKSALKDIPWELLPAFDFPNIPEIVEDGQTLEENSFKKANIISQITGYAALADDTGLFVDALGGKPGIYAARFAGENCSYQDNIEKLLKSMNGVVPDKRTALFKTVITIVSPDQKINQVSGEIIGQITEEPRGNDGFGYDPIFEPIGFKKVFAEMSTEEKNRISHRGKALQKARILLNEIKQ